MSTEVTPCKVHVLQYTYNDNAKCACSTVCVNCGTDTKGNRFIAFKPKTLSDYRLHNHNRMTVLLEAIARNVHKNDTEEIKKDLERVIRRFGFLETNIPSGFPQYPLSHPL